MSCKKQRFSKRFVPSVVALWLFVCVWCPLTHFQSHNLRTETAALTSTPSDSCSLCLLESLPICLTAVAIALFVPALFVPEPASTRLLLTGQALLPTLSTRGPPDFLS
ncbi:hypothetical protein [Armatimonas sp.]|uniref:hypothetical protein n=1 Tax=Armatimonas sp. TaxID=1872638 RepID=UPI003752661B